MWEMYENGLDVGQAKIRKYTHCTMHASIFDQYSMPYQSTRSLKK